ncbi:MAG: ABC transporter permease, partial [Ulvibacter sp.]|nr:ABC transporter permease [Ulvibacter sp.]
MKKATSLSQLAFQKFCKNFWGMLSVVFLTLAVLVAIFAYGLAPDNSENANQMHLSIHSKAPGFTVKMLVLPAGLEKQKGFYTFFFG